MSDEISFDNNRAIISSAVQHSTVLLHCTLKANYNYRLVARPSCAPLSNYRPDRSIQTPREFNQNYCVLATKTPLTLHWTARGARTTLLAICYPRRGHRWLLNFSLSLVKCTQLNPHTFISYLFLLFKLHIKSKKDWHVWRCKKLWWKFQFRLNRQRVQMIYRCTK